MVNNYPEYAAGVNFKKTDSNGVRHFYSAQVVADPSDDTIESKLIKDGVVISEGGGGGSSDFNTAEVTINATIEGSPTLVYKGFSATIQYPEGSNSQYFGGFVDFTGDVLLYQNNAIISADEIFAVDSNDNNYGVLTAITPTTSGNATYDSENNVFIITGDCTINITMGVRN